MYGVCWVGVIFFFAIQPRYILVYFIVCVVVTKFAITKKRRRREYIGNEMMEGK